MLLQRQSLCALIAKIKSVSASVLIQLKKLFLIARSLLKKGLRIIECRKNFMASAKKLTKLYVKC